MFIDIWFSIIPFFILIVFSFKIGVFVYVFSKTIKQAKINKNSPRLTVYAKVVAKRNHYYKNSSSMMSSSRYYATFEVESGDRMELLIPSQEIGMLVEGDTGTLTFQGNMFISFDREY